MKDLINFKVQKFKYNGFFVTVKTKPEFYKFKAIFIGWTNDPGIAICKCSDGKIRYIPSCCLHSSIKFVLPTQKYHSNENIN